MAYVYPNNQDVSIKMVNAPFAIIHSNLTKLPKNVEFKDATKQMQPDVPNVNTHLKDKKIVAYV